MKETKCDISGFDKMMQSFAVFSFLFQFVGLVYFSFIASKRSKRKQLVLPKSLTFRVYGPISGGQFISMSLWAYGIPTFLSYALKGVENISGDCMAYIEVKIYVPETRYQQADLLMRQWINAGYNSIVLLSPPVENNLKYAYNTPMNPIGIPYKPIMLVEKLMMIIFAQQLDSLPNSHKNVLKRKKQAISQPKIKTEIKKISRKTKKTNKINPTTKPRNKSAKLFD